MNKSKAIILSGLITLFLGLNYYAFTGNIIKEPREKARIERVVDGDTLIIQGTSNRLVNINSFEKGEKGSELAKAYLKKYENKTVEIEDLGQDKYNRRLIRVYSGNTYLNYELVNQGLARHFLVQQSELRLFAEAEKKAIEQERGIWNKSEYYGCIESKISEKSEEIELNNHCKQSVSTEGWTIRDESRKVFNLPDINLERLIISSKTGLNTKSKIYLNSSTDVWNNDRDTLYLFDQDEKIVDYHPYGY